MLIRTLICRRLLHTRTVLCSKDQHKAAKPSEPEPSAATPSPPDKPVGPGAFKSGQYKMTEYFQYTNMSYFDLESEMQSFRLPQPSSK